MTRAKLVADKSSYPASADDAMIVATAVHEASTAAREQQEQARIKGVEAQKSNISAARAVSNLLRTSLGPKGMDTMMVSTD